MKLYKNLIIPTLKEHALISEEESQIINEYLGGEEYA